MAEKRRDNKGRILRNGEFQRKDGKYEYKYIDSSGKRHSVYSWKLVDTDKILAGKRCKESLREMEKQIQRDLDDGIDTATAAKITLNQAFQRYMNTKVHLKENTRVNYWQTHKRYIQNTIGEQNVINIKISDVYNFYMSLSSERNLAIGTILIVHKLLSSTFSMLIDDDIVRKNPTTKAIKNLKNSIKNKKNNRVSNTNQRLPGTLTKKQTDIFLDFVSASNVYKKWLPLFTVLLGTGMRIGECIALQWDDCDFSNNTIHINHNLVYFYRENIGYAHSMCTPKTEAGEREIKMLSDVRAALLQIKAYQRFNKIVSPNVDGFNNFVFINRNGNPYNEHLVRGGIERAIKKCNKIILENSQEKNPQLLPHFSPHNFRHTFCTRFCENETNIKAIQEIMGHINAATTMNIYNKATKEIKEQSMKNLESKMRIC